MNKIIITRGIPASGKSTWARSWVNENTDNRIEVNRDNIRTMFGFPSRGDHTQENMVTKVHREMIHSAITANKDIVVSDTNMRPKYIKDFVKIAINADYDIEIKDFPVDFDTACARDRNREDSVGEDVIRDFHQRFPFKNWIPGETIINDVIKNMNQGNDMEPYVNDPDNPDAILVDVDGTIAHNKGVRDYFDYTKVMMDTPDPSVIRAVNIAHDAGIKVIIMSGRKEMCREDTIAWMDKYGVSYDEVHMREDDDNRKDWIIKDEMVRAHIQNRYHIIWCYDDRNQVVDHHRAMGYQVFQVAPGDF